MTYVLLVFAIIFLIVGIFRVVELKAAGISDRQRKVLSPLHILGCVCFSGAMALLALDQSRAYKTESTLLFFAGVLLLFPLHIYVAIKRKIRMPK